MTSLSVIRSPDRALTGHLGPVPTWNPLPPAFPQGLGCSCVSLSRLLDIAPEPHSAPCEGMGARRDCRSV